MLLLRIFQLRRLLTTAYRCIFLHLILFIDIFTSALNFLLTQGSSLDEAEGIATDMQYYPDKDVLSGDILMQEFDANIIHSLLGMACKRIRHK